MPCWAAGLEDNPGQAGGLCPHGADIPVGRQTQEKEPMDLATGPCVKPQAAEVADDSLLRPHLG